MKPNTRELSRGSTTKTNNRVGSAYARTRSNNSNKKLVATTTPNLNSSMRDKEHDNDVIKNEVNQPIIKVRDQKIVHRARLNKFGSSVGKSNASISRVSN